MDTSNMTKIQLLEKCKELKIIKCQSKNKSELMELINLTNKLHDFNPAFKNIPLLPSLIKEFCSSYNL
jgi:hypothetical protein